VQQLTHFIGKYFFIKSRKNNRLGYFHQSIGTLAFAYFGLDSKSYHYNNYVSPIKKYQHHVNINKPSNYIRFLYSEDTHENIFKYTYFDVHCPSYSYEVKSVFPIAHLYEDAGYCRDVTGDFRKHIKVVNAPSIDENGGPIVPNFEVVFSL
jgi:hypothetical protein